MYFRISTSQMHSGSGYPRGVFSAAYDLKHNNTLSSAEYKELRDVLLWFEKNLPIPGNHRIHPQAIFWFKPYAEDCIKEIWKLVNILRCNDYLVYDVACKRPGKVIYEDDYQVAAIPFNDTRGRLL